MYVYNIIKNQLVVLLFFMNRHTTIYTLSDDICFRKLQSTGSRHSRPFHVTVMMMSLPSVLLRLLLQVDFGMPLLFVTSREFPTTSVTGEGFLTSVGPDVCREVVGPAERPHAHSTLERLLSCVDSYMSGELVTAREPPVARVDGTRVRSLMDGGLARAVGVLARFDGQQLQRYRTVLKGLVEDLVSFARGLVVLGQGGCRLDHNPQFRFQPAGGRLVTVDLLMSR